MRFSLSTLTVLLVALLCTCHHPVVESLKINKNTMELLNNGLKAIVSIRQILNAIKSVNELSQALPALAPATSAAALVTKPRISLVQRLFGRIPLQKNVNSKSLNGGKARDPSIGLIKIGEKPPPGLFPETLPYSVSQLEQSAGGADGFKLTDTNPTGLKTPESQINRYLVITDDPYQSPVGYHFGNYK